MAGPYRKEHAALRARVDALVEEKRRLDAWSRDLDDELASMQRELSAHGEQRTRLDAYAGIAWLTGLGGAGVCASFALIALVARLPEEQVARARDTAAAIQRVTDRFTRCEGDLPCPTVDDLIEVRGVNPRDRLDPWGHPYRVECPEPDGSYHVFSNGRDGIPKTFDDIRHDFTDKDVERVAGL